MLSLSEVKKYNKKVSEGKIKGLTFNGIHGKEELILVFPDHGDIYFEGVKSEIKIYPSFKKLQEIKKNIK
jgi:hypothetical protein